MLGWVLSDGWHGRWRRAATTIHLASAAGITSESCPCIPRAARSFSSTGPWIQAFPTAPARARVVMSVHYDLERGWSTPGPKAVHLTAPESSSSSTLRCHISMVARSTGERPKSKPFDSLVSSM